MGLNAKRIRRGTKGLNLTVENIDRNKKMRRKLRAHMKHNQHRRDRIQAAQDILSQMEK